MRILFVAESFPTSNHIDITGGVEAGDWEIAQRLAKKHQVTVITTNRYGVESEARLKNIRIIRVGVKSYIFNRESTVHRLSFIRGCLSIIPTLDIELITASNVFTQWIAIQAYYQVKRPMIARIADIYLGSWIKNTSPIIGLAGELIERQVLSFPWKSISFWSKATAIKFIPFQKKSPAITTIIPGGLNHRLINQITATKNKYPVICSVGRLVKYKHLDVVIKSIHLLQPRYPQIKLNLIGHGSELHSLKKLTDQLHLNHKINFIGYLTSYIQVLKKIKSATIFSLPSSVEGFGLVTLEACALKVPYINLNIPATAEITHSGQGGILLDSPDENLLAEAIDQLLSNPKLYNSKVKEGLRLTQNYDWDKTALLTEKLFIKSISSKN